MLLLNYLFYYFVLLFFVQIQFDTYLLPLETFTFLVFLANQYNCLIQIPTAIPAMAKGNQVITLADTNETINGVIIIFAIIEIAPSGKKKDETVVQFFISIF